MQMLNLSSVIRNMEAKLKRQQAAVKETETHIEALRKLNEEQKGKKN